MLKAIKIRLYPNKTQEEYIGKLLGCYRVVYNRCLTKKIEAYENNKTNLGLKELGKYFHNDLTKDAEYVWLNEHNTKVLKQSIMNLMEAYKRFFVNGNGFPKFKSKHDNKASCRFPSESISKRNNYLDNKITLTNNLKDVKFACSDEYTKYLNKHKEGIKSATLSKTKSGKYFLSILSDGDISKITPKPINDIIGLDLGIKTFIVASNGETFDNIKTKRNNEKMLVKLHRQHSKKQKGSKNREKARIKLARYYEKLDNIKINYLHNITSKLVSENQTIVIEDLNVSGMLKNHNLARSIQELSLYEFKRQLEYKCEWYGRDLVIIDRWFPSSKLCNNCGYKYKDLTLKEREWTCPDCGMKHDRDMNAAINIEDEGKRIMKIGHRLPELTLEDYPTMDEPNRKVTLKSSGRMIQEDESLRSFT